MFAVDVSDSFNYGGCIPAIAKDVTLRSIENEEESCVFGPRSLENEEALLFAVFGPGGGIGAEFKDADGRRWKVADITGTGDFGVRCSILQQSLLERFMDICDLSFRYKSAQFRSTSCARGEWRRGVSGSFQFVSKEENLS